MGRNMTSQMTLCIVCRHYNKGHTCKAYPDKIPLPIWDGDVLHTKPYKGDHGIQFEAKPKKSWKGFY